MRNETLKKLVIQEAKALKKNATKKELERLNFKNLISTHHEACIYGQMTESCFSDRAFELIKKCTKKMIVGRINSGRGGTSVLEECTSVAINKKSRSNYFSPIEMFIAQKENSENGNNKRLIDYLTGTKKELDLK